MGLFTTNVASITRPGLYVVPQKPPAIIKAAALQYGALVGEFPFGPAIQEYTPTSDGDRNLTYAPPGFNRLATGVLAMIEKGWNNLLKIVRVLGSTAATAAVILATSGATNVVTVTALYPGSDANSITATVAAASDGNSNHFNLTVTITGASGTTSEIYYNQNVSGTGANLLGGSAITSSRLLASITQVSTNTGIPAAGTYALTGGTNGTIAATDYVGTQGNSDKGMALLEGDNQVRSFCTDDCGNSFRAAVNAGLEAHANYMGDRMGVMTGNSGLAASAVQTDAASYQSVGVVYTDPWGQELDDVTGAVQLVPLAPFAMSAMVQTPVSTRIAARSSTVLAMYQGIYGLQYNRGQQAANNTAAGITTFIPNPAPGGGGFCVELDVTTETPVDPTQQDLPRQRVGIYVGTSVQQSLQSYVSGPNVPLTQDQVTTAFTAFLDGLVTNGTEDPFNLPYILGYKMGNIAGSNTPSSLAAGNYIVPVAIQTDTGMQHLIFLVQYGPSVSVSLANGQTATGG